MYFAFKILNYVNSLSFIRQYGVTTNEYRRIRTVSQLGNWGKTSSSVSLDREWCGLLVVHTSAVCGLFSFWWHMVLLLSAWSKKLGTPVILIRSTIISSSSSKQTWSHLPFPSSVFNLLSTKYESMTFCSHSYQPHLSDHFNDFLLDMDFCSNLMVDVTMLNVF